MCPLVSIAIISYNQGQYLRECLESCISQSYSNLEVIVSDNASTDSSKTIIEEYVRRYPRIVTGLFLKSNVGLTGNCNNVLSSCNGKYVAFLCADDVLHSEKISRQVQFLELNPSYHLCFHSMDLIDENSAHIGGQFKTSGVSVIEQMDADFYVRNGCLNCASATMYRRSKVPPSGFDQSLPVASDWLFWVDLIGNGGYIGYIDEVLGCYRKHAKSVTAQHGISQNMLDHLNSCNIIIKKYPHLRNAAISRYCDLLFIYRKHGGARWYVVGLLGNLSLGKIKWVGYDSYILLKNLLIIGKRKS